jgi:hypothetical protein
MRESKRRKSAFREVAKDYNRDPHITDRPGTIAKMMEMAFQAGVESVQSPGTHADASPAMLGDLDVPSMSRDLLEYWRRFRFGVDHKKAYPTINRYAFILQPKVRGLPATMSRDNWHPNDDGYRNEPRSNKVINPLIKLGLLERRTLGDGETVAAVLTEWGYELLATGKTSLPENRSVGASSTYDRYGLLYHPGRDEYQPDGRLHVDELDLAVAQFVILNRVHGVGNPDRYPDGMVLEDIAYYPQQVTTHRFWHPYRRYDGHFPMSDHDVARLEKAGILDMENGAAIVSEWGYELIVKGSTTLPDDRKPGRSSTYRRYFQICQARL